jgi:hypothetical protein
MALVAGLGFPGLVSPYTFITEVPIYGLGCPRGKRFRLLGAFQNH